MANMMMNECGGLGMILPIMWSRSTGSEVMKPLATPVLGGSIGSIGLHNFAADWLLTKRRKGLDG